MDANIYINIERDRQRARRKTKRGNNVKEESGRGDRRTDSDGARQRKTRRERQAGKIRKR